MATNLAGIGLRVAASLALMQSCVAGRADEIGSCISISNYREIASQANWYRNSGLRSADVYRSIRAKLSGQIPIPISEVDVAQLVETPVPGESDLLVYRRRFKGWKEATDTGAETVLTIVIPKIPPTGIEATLGDKGETEVFLRSGSPGFGNYCVGYAVSGKLNIHTNDPNGGDIGTRVVLKASGIKDGVHVAIEATFKLADLKGTWPESCGICSFKGDLAFEAADGN